MLEMGWDIRTYDESDQMGWDIHTYDESAAGSINVVLAYNILYGYLILYPPTIL